LNFVARSPQQQVLVNSGITLAAISTVLLNALFNCGGSDAEAQPDEHGPVWDAAV
jgi:xanthine/uracil permease